MDSDVFNDRTLTLSVASPNELREKLIVEQKESNRFKYLNLVVSGSQVLVHSFCLENVDLKG